MTVSISDRKSRIDDATAAPEKAVWVTVTGVDVKGQMFRRPATILMLDGRECIFRSDCQPESDGSVLLEFDYRQADRKRHVLHACVKSTSPDKDSGFYRVVIELEVAQTGRILPDPAEAQAVTIKSAPRSVPAGTAHSAEGKGGPVTEPRNLPSPPLSNGTPHAPARPNYEGSPKVKSESGELLPKTQAENPIAVREALKLAVASEIKQELNLLKIWVSSELEKTLPGIVSSNMEKMIREAVEKQTSVNYEISNQALNANVARQVEDRIAELHLKLEGTTKKLVDEQTELSRTAGDGVEQELSSHAAAIMRSFEESTAEIAKKLLDDQTELSRTAGDHFELELSSRAATIMRSFEESTAEMAKKLLDGQAEHSRTAEERVELELSSRAATIMRSFEESTAETAKKLFEVQSELTRTAGDNVEQELSSRATTIMRSFEESTAEMAKKLFEVQSELSRTAGDNVEQELSSRAATILRSFEESTAESAKKLFDEQTELWRTAGERVEQTLSSRAATIMRSFEESTAEMAKKLFDEQTEVSRTAGDRVEFELSSRAATIIRSFEESTTEIAKKLSEEQAELSRTAGDRVEQELSSRAATITQSLEESTAEMEARINASRAATEVVLTRSQALQQEINDGMPPLQHALQQLNDANRAGIENLQSEAVSEISRCAAQFQNQLDKVSRERAVEFLMEIEKRLAPNQQQADELLEKLGAVFQLLQSTARVQQERLTEHSKATAASFEKEIRSLLLRLAGGA